MGLHSFLDALYSEPFGIKRGGRGIDPAIDWNIVDRLPGAAALGHPELAPMSSE